MRIATVFALVLISAAALGQSRVYNRNCDVASRRSDRGGIDCPSTGRTLALFEFAPPEGTGMGAACACAAVTGSKGETITFSRASAGACIKGNETSGIANGDVVFCASGQPRVMPGGDGTGGLGVSIWEARTNSTLRSQEFENAAWVPTSSGVAAPVVTANQATAPDGTVTADKVDLPTSSGANYSVLVQAAGCPAAGLSSRGVYAKMVSGTGTVEINGPGGTNGPNVTGSGYMHSCAINATSWTRCYVENIPATAAFYIGYGGNSDSPEGPAESIYLWQADCQQGASFSPPIATTSAAATRAVETVSPPRPTGISATGCVSSKLVAASSIPMTAMPVVVGSDYGIYTDSPNPGKLYMYDGTNSLGPVAVNLTSSTTFAASWSGVTMNGSAYGATISGTFDGSMYGAGSMNLGGRAVGNYMINSVLKSVKIDSTTTGCLP